MERKIGNTFKYEGKKIEVKAASNGCDGCFFEEKDCIESAELLGKCGAGDRTDKKHVVFVEVQEQQQEQVEPPKLNLCEILKDCPNGELFWSSLLGDVKLYDIDEEAKTVVVTTKDLVTWEINADGTITIDELTSPEIMLFPSREQREWTKVKYEPKKERFDPKTLNPFDRVLVRNDKDCAWHINIYSHKNNHDKNYPYNCIMSYFKYCIPYNDDTKHLVGTEEEAPDFYKYWED